MFRFISIRLVLLLAACLVCPAAWANGAKHIKIVQTFEPARNNGTPLVQVRFSSTVIGTFAIDTGNYESEITDAFAKKLDLKLTADKNLRFFGFRPVMVVQIPEIKLDDLTVEGQTFHVVADDFLPPLGGREIDGILGGDLLSRFALRIDYPAHEIDWITPGNLDAEAAAELGFTPQNLVVLGQERLPWDNSKINHYSLRADFQNRDRAASEDLEIDTGSYDTLVSTSLADKLSLTPLSTGFTRTLSEPLAPVSLSAVAKMQIGQTVLSDVAVTSPQRNDSGFPSLLGENVLSDCVVLLDFGPHRFYLRPVLPPAKPESAAPLDKAQILWDRLRAAPDLPTVEEMLAEGFAPDAQDDLAEQAARLRSPLPGSAEDVERLEKLGALLRRGQDETGAKAAFAQAVTRAAAQARLESVASARQWVQALTLADREDEAAAAATQTTVHLPNDASGWRLLGDALTVRLVSILVGHREAVTEEQVRKITQQAPGGPPTAAQAAQMQILLVQAHAAFDRSIALAPSDAAGYRDRALFRLLSRAALSAIQRASIRINLPAAEVPPVETALAEAVADWQQWAALSPDDLTTLAAAAYLDHNLTDFHNRSWLLGHLKGTQSISPATLMTAESVEARLTLKTQNKDKTLAASAWTALGTVQSEKPGGAGEKAAENSWRQALALDPAQSEALTALALHLQQNGRWVELHDLLTHQAAANDTVPTRLALASLLSAENLPAEAEAQARAALALAPSNAAANLMLAGLLLSRSGGDAAALPEASACLAKARLGYGSLATAEQKATLTTSEAVRLALGHDPDAAEKQLVRLAEEQPNCTQAREALAALIPY